MSPTAGQLTVDRSHASWDPRARTGAYAVPARRRRSPGSPVELRVIMDGSIAEIYLATGQVLTIRFYPLGDAPWRLQARTIGTGSSDFAVEAWDLNPRQSVNSLSRQADHGTCDRPVTPPTMPPLLTAADSAAS